MSVIRSEAYQYSALDYSGHCVRLLTVLSNSTGDEDAISLKLEDVTLDDVRGEYDAISYTWGPELPQHQVWIDGEPLDVRSNIWHFLQHYRRSRCGSVRLWVDSICINQRDIEEKNHQVAHMRHVYSQARRVLIWLDIVSQQSLFGKLCVLELYAGSRAGGPELHLSHDMFRPYHQREAEARRRGMQSLLMDELDAISKHCYWQRVWILQEVLLASDVFVVLGEHLVNATFTDKKGGFCSRDHSFWTWLNEDAADLLRQKGTSFNPWLSIWYPLEKWHKSQCQDVRDKVYGLLGLTKGAETFTIDYRCEVEELLIHTLDSMGLESEVDGPHSRRFGLYTTALVMQILQVTFKSFEKFFHTSFPIHPELFSTPVQTGVQEAFLLAPCGSQHANLLPCSTFCRPSTEAKIRFGGAEFAREYDLFTNQICTDAWRQPGAVISCTPGGSADRMSHGGMLVFGNDVSGNLRPVWIAGRRNGWEAEHVPEHLADDFVLRLGGATIRWASPIESGPPYGDAYIECSVLGLLYLAEKS